MPARKPGEVSLPVGLSNKMSADEKMRYERRRRARYALRALNIAQLHVIGPLYKCVVGKGNGLVHIAPGFWIKAAKHKRKARVQTQKLPGTDARWAAVEIEFTAAASRDFVEDMFAEDTELSNAVHLKSDSSLSGSERRPHTYELVLCAELEQMPGVIRRACAILARQEVDGGVNRSCGLHIHLDMRHDNVNHAHRNLVRAYPLLCKLVPRHRVDNEYCLPPHSEDFQVAFDEGDRYRAINPRAFDVHNTLEIRIFGGTVNADKINQYLQIVSSIAYAEETLPCMEDTSIDSFGRVLHWPSVLVSWAKDRALVLGNQP